MGGLEDRLRRLEKEAARAGVPGWKEYEAASDRERVRTLMSAFSKMLGKHNPERRHSEQDRALLEGDTEEQRQRDRDVIAWYEEAHGVQHDPDALAEKARQRLRDVGRSE